MRIIILVIYSKHKNTLIQSSWLQPHHCNPLEKHCAANLLNFHTRNTPKVHLASWTNIITLFMNTVKHFVKRSMQKFEIIQRKVLKWINCCLTLRHFFSNFGFTGLMMLHLKSQFWLAESTEPKWLIFGRLATHSAFFWNCMSCGVDFMIRCVHLFISKISQIWAATTSRAL